MENYPIYDSVIEFLELSLKSTDFYLVMNGSSKR